MVKYSFRKDLPFSPGLFSPSVYDGIHNIPIIDDDEAGLDREEAWIVSEGVPDHFPICNLILKWPKSENHTNLQSLAAAVFLCCRVSDSPVHIEYQNVHI